MLVLDHVTVAYGQRLVLEDFSLRIEHGEFLALLGPNGCGKSTLLRTLMGYLQPRAGSVRLNDQDLNSIPSRERARLMAVVAQEEAVEFEFTVEETVLMGRTPYLNVWGRPTTHDHQVARTAMEQTQIERLRERKVTELSGGERRRVMLARALAQEPHVLLLDEPTSNLDLRAQCELLDLLQRLNREQQVTIVVAIHQINQAAASARSMVLLNQEGRIYAQGTPAETITRENLQSVFGIATEVYPHPESGRPQVLVTYPSRD